MMELKTKFEFIERIADLTTHEDRTESEIIYMGEKSKKVIMKNKVNDTFFEIKKYLGIIGKGRIELEFEATPIDKVEDLDNIIKELHDTLRRSSKLMTITNVNYLVEISLGYDLEVYISGESNSGLREIKELQEKLPASDKLRTTPRLYGKKGLWKSFVVKCDLEKLEISKQVRIEKRIEL